MKLIDFQTTVLMMDLADMFRALQKSDLPQDHVYSVTVGASSKQTDASWHLLEPADVINTVQMLYSSSNQDF